MTAPRWDSYLICATPRAGSTLLCGLLESSGVAGHPASYFNRAGLHQYADSWRIARPREGRIGDAYLRAALAAGTTPNGVFGGRIMAESLPELITDLAAAAGSAGWTRWFAAQSIEPWQVVYEELAADPLGTAQGVLDHLGLQVPPDRQLVVGHRRQADHINADWTARFRAN